MTKIVALVRVEDTREWVEGPDGRWHALAGSGQQRACDRCQRLHEVHATVELDDGSTAVVGTGCMRGEDSTLVQKLRSADRAAKKARRALFEGRKRAKLAHDYEIAKADVEQLELPPVTTTVETRQGAKVTILRMGDASVWHLRETLSPSDREERVGVLTQTWRSRRLAERGIGHVHRLAFRELAAQERG